LDISFSYAYNSSLPNHVHRFIALNCSPGRWVREEPQAQLELPLHKPMILLNDVVHVLAGPALAFLGQQFILLQIADGANVSGVLIYIDYPWGSDMRPA
jgi:hypothetical protein